MGLLVHAGDIDSGMCNVVRLVFEHGYRYYCQGSYGRAKDALSSWPLLCHHMGGSEFRVSQYRVMNHQARECLLPLESACHLRCVLQ